MSSKHQNSLYFKNDNFYYLSASNTEIERNNKLSSIFGEEINDFFIGYKLVNRLCEARFWKDEMPAKNFIFNELKIRFPHGSNKLFHGNATYIVNKLSRDEFINTIPDYYEIDNFVTIRNLKLKKEETEYKKKWDVLRSKYKAIDSYIKVPDPSHWLPCKSCGLIPLIWEFDNGRSTACGCGESIYNHHSIKAESIMSYIKRNNGSMAGYDNDELKRKWNKFNS